MSVVGLVESIVAVDVANASQPVVERLLGDVRRVRGWLDSVEVAAAARLAELDEKIQGVMVGARCVADVGQWS